MQRNMNIYDIQNHIKSNVHWCRVQLICRKAELTLILLLAVNGDAIKSNLKMKTIITCNTPQKYFNIIVQNCSI